MTVVVRASAIEDPSRLDDEILRAVPSICDLLGLERLSPEKLVWKDSGGEEISVPSDYVFINGKKMFLASICRES